MDNTKSFQRKLVFESNIKKYIDQSQTQSHNNNSFVVKSGDSKRRRGQRVDLQSNKKGSRRLERNEV